MKKPQQEALIEAREYCTQLVRDLPQEALPEAIVVLKELARAYDKSQPPMGSPHPTIQ